MTTLTDKQQYNAEELFRRLADRVERAKTANNEVRYDMLGKVIVDAKTLRKILAKTKRG